MKIKIGYPDAEAEKNLLLGQDRRQLLQQLQAVISVDKLMAIQAATQDIHVSSAIIDYVQQLLAVNSTGRCNTLIKFSSWCHITQGFSWSCI